MDSGHGPAQHRVSGLRVTAWSGTSLVHSHQTSTTGSMLTGGGGGSGPVGLGEAVLLLPLTLTVYLSLDMPT